MNTNSIIFLLALFLTLKAHAFETISIHKALADAIICTEGSADTVSNIAQKGGNFKLGYAAYGFGDGTSYKAVVILNEPLTIHGSTALAVVSEAEPSYFDFSAFSYAKFKGDYTQVVKALNLQPTKSFTEASIGKYVSIQPSPDTCPKTIALTPIDDEHFLLGCGWCNGG